MSEKPPEEKVTACSGLTWRVPPTDVTQGQEAGKMGRNRGVLLPSLVRQDHPGPVSPDAKITEVPRAPRRAKRLQTVWR